MLEQVALQNKEFTNQHQTAATEFQPENLVRLSTKDLRNPQNCQKLMNGYTSPYKVFQCTNKVMYGLELPKDGRLSCLKPAV